MYPVYDSMIIIIIVDATIAHTECMVRSSLEPIIVKPRLHQRNMLLVAVNKIQDIDNMLRT